MSQELKITDPDELAHEVVLRRLKGMHPAEIAEELGIGRAKVNGFLDVFNNIAHGVPELKNRAKEAVAGMDVHYQDLIKQAYSQLEEIDRTDNQTPAMYAQKTALFKFIAGLEESRIKSLQQAGLIDDMGDEVAELMEKNEILEGIIRDVSAKCPHCKLEVARRLGQYTGQVEVIPDA